MKKLSMAVAVAAASAVSPALAASGDASYVALRAGANEPRETAFSTDDVVTATTTVRSRYKTGYSTALAMGRRFDIGRKLNLRAEFELGYSQAEADVHQATVVDRSGPVPRTLSQGRLASAEGDLLMTTGFLNVYGEKALKVFPDTTFLFGGGAGPAHVDFDGFGAGSTGMVMDDDDVTYGFQLSAGWAHHLTEQFALEATYRYQSIQDVALEAEATGADSDHHVDAHHFLAGVRYSF